MKENKETPHLDYYRKMMEDNNNPNYFLCNRKQLDQQLIQLFKPTPEQVKEYNHHSYAWGAYFTNDKRDEIITGFNDFRQNVVLFVACILEEY